MGVGRQREKGSQSVSLPEVSQPGASQPDMEEAGKKNGRYADEVSKPWETT